MKHHATEEKIVLDLLEYLNTSTTLSVGKLIEYSDKLEYLKGLDNYLDKRFCWVQEIIGILIYRQSKEAYIKMSLEEWEFLIGCLNVIYYTI